MVTVSNLCQPFQLFFFHTYTSISQSLIFGNFLSATILASWLTSISCTRLSQPWCQDVLSEITLDLFGGLSVLDHFYYRKLVIFDHHLYLLNNASKLLLGPEHELHERMGKVFNNAMLLFFLVVCFDLNCGWFAPHLLFERVVSKRSNRDGCGSGSRCNAGDGFSSKSDKDDCNNDSVVQSDLEKALVYRVEKQLL